MPTSIVCVNGLLVMVSMPTGQCKEAEALARKSLSLSPDSLAAYLHLAESLVAQGQPLPAARQALTQWEMAIEARGTAVMKDGMYLQALRAENQSLMSVLSGDFLSAEKAAKSAVELRESSVMRSDHSMPTLMLAEILQEMGKTQELGKLIEGYLSREAAWEPPTEGVDFDEPHLLRLLHFGASFRRGLCQTEGRMGS